MWYRPDGRYDDQLTVDDVTLSVLPMSHQYAYVTLISSLLVGHRIVVMSPFKPDEYVRLADKYKVNACRDVNKTFVFSRPRKDQDQDRRVVIFTSAKEDMQSSLSVCLFATLRRNFRTDLLEISRESWQRIVEQTTKCWWRSGS